MTEMPVVTTQSAGKSVPSGSSEPARGEWQRAPSSVGRQEWSEVLGLFSKRLLRHGWPAFGTHHETGQWDQPAWPAKHSPRKIQVLLKRKDRGWAHSTRPGQDLGGKM